MKLIEVIQYREQITSEVGFEPISFGLYSVNRHDYFKGFCDYNVEELSFVGEPYAFYYSVPKINNIIEYLLRHKGCLYVAAHQRGCRHGYYIKYDLERLKEKFSSDKNYYQELSGQLCFCF